MSLYKYWSCPNYVYTITFRKVKSFISVRCKSTLSNGLKRWIGWGLCTFSWWEWLKPPAGSPSARGMLYRRSPPSGQCWHLYCQPLHHRIGILGKVHIYIYLWREREREIRLGPVGYSFDVISKRRKRKYLLWLGWSTPLTWYPNEEKESTESDSAKLEKNSGC